MAQISESEAEIDHGISTAHEVMRNGELRFRLKKDDGTAYIRTESGPTGDWQRSHFHKHLTETYIVQEGWIAVADKFEGRIRLRQFKAGDVFSTQKNVIHNIYMPVDSIIHTVKHGPCKEADRYTNGETSEFDDLVRTITNEDTLRSLTTEQSSARITRYTEEYRHFDNLIWQAPAWASAIFALSFQSFDEDIQRTISSLANLPREILAQCFLLVMAIALMCFAFVMYRFRRHQQSLKHYKPTRFWRSAATYTQLLICVESGCLLSLALLIGKADVSWTVAVFLGYSIFCFGIFEYFLRHSAPIEAR